MLTTTLAWLILATGLVHIVAEYWGPRWAVYLFKPLTTTLIILTAWQISRPVSPFYQSAILVGLLCSLAGDVFLMLPNDRFIAGLVSFLIAHLCYIGAFTSRSGFQFTPLLLVPFLLYGALMLRLLWTHVGAMQIPVGVYMAAILIMGWQAAEQWQQTEQSGAQLALMGALLFIISDSTLALDHFRKPFKMASWIILSTYYMAQWLIALSIR